MMKQFILLAIAMLNIMLYANSGDTTTIFSHQNQDLHWQGSSYGGKYDEIVN